MHLKCFQLHTFVKWLVALNVVCMIMKYVGIHAIHRRQRYYVNGEGCKAGMLANLTVIVGGGTFGDIGGQVAAD